MTHPQIGDLVLETSTVQRTAPHWSGGTRWDEERLGYLRRIRYVVHPQDDDDGFIELGEKPDGYSQQVWYIETLNGREVRWGNANFIKICTTIPELTRMKRDRKEAP